MSTRYRRMNNAEHFPETSIVSDGDAGLEELATVSLRPTIQGINLN